MRCDYIAEGVIKATKELSMDIPLVVRLKGTKEQEAKEFVLFFSSAVSDHYFSMIKESGLKIVAFDSLDEAAARAVTLAN